MQHFDKVFLSSTYAPEALTLAAAIENLKIYKSDNVIKNFWMKGEYVEKILLKLLKNIIYKIMSH